MLRISTDHNQLTSLRELAAAPLQRARQQLVQQALQLALQAAADETPVDTGRARSGWLDAAAAPTAVVDDGTAVSTADGTNTVEYIALLEYGTRDRQAHAMARKALESLGPQLPALFRWPG